jgi:hypothetical protein
MWFLIKTSVVFAAGLVVLSYFSSHPPAPTDNAAGQLQLADAFTAATGAYTYLSGLCSEKPEVCVKGGETFTALAIRAKEGARVAYEFLDRQLAPVEQDATASAAPAAPSSAMLPLMPKLTLTSAPGQPLPQKIAEVEGRRSTDSVVTGTVPLPQKRPER